MRAIVQRVTSGKVSVDGETIGEIGKGLVVLLGVGEGDTEADVKYLKDKTCGLRIFSDADDKMNLSLLDIGGEMLVVSQFTLYGDCRKGKRPSFSRAGDPLIAKKLYEDFVAAVREAGIKAATGQFQADMLVEILNDGPVTLMLDSGKGF